MEFRRETLCIICGEWLVGLTHWLTVYRSLLDRRMCGRRTDLDAFVMIKVDGDVCDDNDGSKVGLFVIGGLWC